MVSKIKHLVSFMAWPGLLILCMTTTAYGFAQGHPLLYFNVAYAALIVTLFFLERWMPYEREWTKPDITARIRARETRITARSRRYPKK